MGSLLQFRTLPGRSVTPAVNKNIILFDFPESQFYQHMSALADSTEKNLPMQFPCPLAESKIQRQYFGFGNKALIPILIRHKTDSQHTSPLPVIDIFQNQFPNGFIIQHYGCKQHLVHLKTAEMMFTLNRFIYWDKYDFDTCIYTTS